MRTIKYYLQHPFETLEVAQFAADKRRRTGARVLVFKAKRKKVSRLTPSSG